VPSSVSRAIVQAQAQVLNQQDAVLRANELAKVDPTAIQKAQEEQRKLEEAQKAAAEVAKKPVPVSDSPKLVSAEQRQYLVKLVRDFYEEVKRQSRSPSDWEVGLIFGAMAFGLVSALLSVFSLNKAAAIASAFVVAAGGIPKVYPIHERAVYYRTLTNQSYSLMGSLQIPFQMAAPEYEDGVERLKVLMNYRATRYPESRRY
jgi:hypothetical protein